VISIFTVGIILFVGFLFGEIATKLKLPKVTGYIVGGILLNPGLLHFIPDDFTNHTDFITNLCLSFITFSVGGTLFFPHIKKLGKNILWITLCEAEFAFAAVAIGFFAVTPFFIHLPGATWLTVFIPVSLLIASLASPTDPSATLAVVHEYKAKGNVSSTILGVAAFDDALGIVNYSFAIAFAMVLISPNTAGIQPFLLKTLLSIGGSVLLGAVFGFIFNAISVSVQREKEGVLIVLIFALLSLCFGTAATLGMDQLLATMAMGAIVINFNKQRVKIFKIMERYTEELIFVLFFTLSGMHLNFHILRGNLILVMLFFVFRTFGKIAGTFTGAFLSKAPPKVRKYTAGGLIPQGGIVIGLALMMKQNSSFDAFSDIVLSVIIGATVIHEIIGPILAEKVLERAGEIKK